MHSLTFQLYALKNSEVKKEYVLQKINLPSIVKTPEEEGEDSLQ